MPTRRELIDLYTKAFESGAVIQYKSKGAGNSWYDWTYKTVPSFNMEIDRYRLKPAHQTRDPRIFTAYLAGETIEFLMSDGYWNTVAAYKEPEDIHRLFGDWELRIKPKKPVVVQYDCEVSVDGGHMRQSDSPNLRLTFSDGQLIKAGVL